MHYARTGILAVLGFYFFFYLIEGAQGAPFQEIPQGVNEGLFGGANLYAAKLILAGAILASIGLALSVGKVNFMATLIVMLTTASVLVAMDWLDFWIIIVVVLVVVSMFGKAMITWITGDSGQPGG